MENVLLARVDDRLNHGQVMTAWMKLLPAKEIIVIDNKVAKDEFMITVLEMAAPTSVKVKDFTEENYPWQDTVNWEYVSSDQKLIKEGYKASIHDFVIEHP